MAIAIDITILVIIALTTLIGYKQGLIKAIIKILSFFIAIILAVSLYKPVTNIVIEKTTIDEKIETVIMNKVLPESEEGKQEETVENEEKALTLQTRFSNILKTNVEGSLKIIATALATKIIQLIVFLLIFIIARIVLQVVALITDLIDKIPVINKFNKLGGIIYGFAKGLLIVFAILAIIGLFSPILGTAFMQGLDNSILGSLMYKYNLFLMII